MCEGICLPLKDLRPEDDFFVPVGVPVGGGVEDIFYIFIYKIPQTHTRAFILYIYIQ